MKLLFVYIEKVFNVKRDEFGFVSLLFMHNFFQGIGLALFFTAANAIFLAEASIRQLPLVYIFAAILMIVVGYAYSYLEQRISVKKLLMTVLIIIVISIAGIRLGIMLSHGVWLAFAVIMWYRVVALLNNIEFWGLTSQMLDVRQSKRLFGLISTGEVMAKLIGYFSIPLLVPVIGKENLITIAIIAFAVCIWFLNRISKHSAAQKMDQQAPIKEENSQAENLLSRYMKSDFIILLSLLSFIAIVCFTFIDFSFLFNLQQKYSSGDEIAAFLGVFYGSAKALTFLVKMFFTGRVIDRFGVKNSMLAIPIVFLVITIVIIISKIIFPSGIYMFALFAILLFTLEILRYSFFDPVFFSLFQPLSKKMRLFGHAIVNGFLNPIALGIAGLTLLLLIHFMGIVDLGLISYIISACLIIWVIVVIITNRQYIVVLQNAVTKRHFEGSEMPIQGKLIEGILSTKLKSPYPEEVLYSSELLFKIEKTNKRDIILHLLKHENTEVVKYALGKIEKFKINGLEDVVLKLVNNTEINASIREAAIKAYCSKADSDVTHIYPFLESENHHLRKGAITGLLKNGSLEGVVLSGQQLIKLIESSDEEDNITAIEIIGDLKIKNFYQPLLKFFDHPQSNVVKASITAAGQSLNPKFIPCLLSFLKDRNHAELSAQSLAAFKEKAVVAIDEMIKTAKPSEMHTTQYVRICHILGNIGGGQAHEVLLRMSSLEVAQISNEALISLKKSNYKANIGDTYIRDKFDEQFEQAAWLYNTLNLLEAYKKPDCYLYPALQIELGIVKENMLNILALQYDTRTVIKAREGLLADFSEKKANALEIIDNLISKRLSNRLSLVFEDSPAEEKLKKFAGTYQIKFSSNLQDISIRILNLNDKYFNIWTQVAAIRSFLRFPSPDNLSLILSFADSRAKILRETAANTIYHLIQKNIFNDKNIEQNKLNKIMSQGKSNTLLDIEKVIILKSTSLFTETPENILVDIASIIVEERVEANTKIIQKGEMGTCMYIINEGEVKIHDNEMTFATLKNRDFFGELSLLDPEPRSADVTATKDSLLLRLEQDAFYELMSERMEVAKGILKILCRRLRGQNSVINELKAKMKD